MIPSALLENISTTIKQFQLLEPGEEVIVAFSGGKDSFSLAACLAALGYPVRPIAIDMGYDSEWAKRVHAASAHAGFTTEVIDLHGGMPRSIPLPERRAISLRLDLLQELDSRKSTAATPCTHCYNSKVIALDNVLRGRHRTKVAFGHHLTDACVSLIKEALLRIDHADFGHAHYSRENYESLVEEFSRQAQSYPKIPSKLLDRVTELVVEGQVDTDEPPRQPLRTDREGTEIIRPLFGVWEEDLAQLVVDLGLRTEDSGCGHSSTRNTETPREMVHYRVLRNQVSDQFRVRLAALVASGITSSGYGIRRARYHRVDDLGISYKSTHSISEKL